MWRWVPVLKQIATILIGLGVFAFTTWYGFAQLYRLLSSGHLLAHYGRHKQTSYSTLISYEDAPIDFVANLGGAMLMAGFGAFIWVKVYLRFQQWWASK